MNALIVSSRKVIKALSLVVISLIALTAFTSCDDDDDDW